MATSKKKTKESTPILLTETQIRETQSEIRELEGMLKQDEQRGDKRKISNPDEIRAEILKKTQYLERLSPRKLVGNAANQAYKEAKEIEKMLKEAMPTTNEFYRKYPKNSDSHLKHQKFEEAVRKQMAFQANPKLKEAAMKYKYLMSRLSGGDPQERNLERLRRAR
jgi:hypothetical protein